MATFWEAVSERTKPNWEKLWREVKGKKWEIPTKDRGITCETKIEGLEEINRLMRKPSRGAWHE